MDVHQIGNGKPGNGWDLRHGIKAQWIFGLSLFNIPDLVDFHSEGAEILKVENHKREALL